MSVLIKYKFVLFLIVSIVLTSCFGGYYKFGWDGRLFVINNTNHKIFVKYSYLEKDSSQYIFSYFDGGGYQKEDTNTVVLPHLGLWESSFKEHNKIYIYIFEEKFIDAESIDKKLLLKKSEYTYQELVNLNWKIIYN